MDKFEFDNLLLRFRKGDQSLLKRVFNDFHDPVVRSLDAKLGCGIERAEDLFMEALLVFRKEAMKENVSFINLEGYLYTVAYRIYLRDKKLNKIQSQPEMREIPVVSDTNDKEELDLRHKALALAWEVMGEPCLSLLKDFYYHGFKLKDLQSKYNYSSYDTIKTTKKRCFNKLQELVAEKLLILKAQS